MGLISRELHITDVVLHKNFNFTTQLNDIALLRTSELQQKNHEYFSVSAVVQESKWTWWPFPLYAFLRLNRASAGWREQLQVIIILNLALLNWVPARLGPDRN